MKKLNVLLVFVFFTFQIQFAQTQYKIENNPTNAMDIIINPFGMENPITIGTLSKSGDIQIDFPKELKNISKDDKESMSSELWYTLFSNCNNASEMVAEKDNIFSFKAGNLSLSNKDNPYAGVIFTVSNEDLIPWIEDPGYMEPVLESYFELIYVAKPFQYQGSCESGRMLDDYKEIEITYNFNLNLKAGFNFIEYKIESIYKTDPDVMASFPDKVTITNTEGIPDCKWIANYFYN